MGVFDASRAGDGGDGSRERQAVGLSRLGGDQIGEAAGRVMGKVEHRYSVSIMYRPVRFDKRVVPRGLGTPSPYSVRQALTSYRHLPVVA